MAIPHFLICSRSFSDDKDTRHLSIFEIVDKLVLSELPSPEAGSVLFIGEQRFVVVSAWMIDIKNGETYEDEFEFKTTFKMENGSILRMHLQTFKFTVNMPLHRMMINMIGSLPLKQSGILLVECTVKKIGSQNSKTQTYRMFVEYQKSGETDESTDKTEITSADRKKKPKKF